MSAREEVETVGALLTVLGRLKDALAPGQRRRPYRGSRRDVFFAALA